MGEELARLERGEGGEHCVGFERGVVEVGMGVEEVDVAEMAVGVLRCRDRGRRRAQDLMQVRSCLCQSLDPGFLLFPLVPVCANGSCSAIADV